MASTVTELLRRRFGGKKEVDPLEGWMIGYRLNINGEVASATSAISPYFDASGDVYYFGTRGSSVNLGIWVYSDNMTGSFLSWADLGRGEHSFTIPTTYTKFRISMYLPTIDNAYLKDSNDNYIWKGKNVI